MKIDGDISNPTGLDDEDLAGFFISQHVSDKRVTKMSANALLLLTKKAYLAISGYFIISAKKRKW